MLKLISLSNLHPRTKELCWRLLESRLLAKTAYFLLHGCGTSDDTYRKALPAYLVVDHNRTSPRGVLICFSARGRAAEQGIIFRIPTPGQGIVFVKIGSMTGSIFVIFDSKRSF